jgi:hypothetical protein
MRFFAFFLLAAAVAAGCGETAASTSPDNAGNVASTDPDGGFGSPEGGVDGGDPDGGVDGGLDGGEPDGGGSWCETGGICPACPDREALCDSENPCAVGEVCIPTGCEDLSRCFVTGGGACVDDEDCGTPAYACNQTIRRCLRIDSGCDDSNDCVAGFACEYGTCADRRVPCESGSDCPHGYRCFFPSADQRFCRRITRPCDDNVDCLTLGVPCGNADGVGGQECMPSLPPESVSCDNVECTLDAPVCETSVAGLTAVCGQFGLCASTADCVDVDRFDCRDLWGDGRKECVLKAGSCVDSRGCGPRQVCGSPRMEAPPLCIGGAAM